MADSLVPPWHQEVPLRGMASWRAWMRDHLHHHPDHRSGYPKGHDFTLVPTMDIARQHERLHWHLSEHGHDRPWHVLGKEKEEGMSKALDLKVTVSGDDPDAILAKTDKLNLWLSATPYRLKVVTVERLDGQPIGLESEFEAYWRGDVGQLPDDDLSEAKLYARQAFLYAARKFGKEGK